ncbi:MAG: tRNA methyltransferase, partial [Candidatus Thiodiazotropha endolucinida]
MKWCRLLLLLPSLALAQPPGGQIHQQQFFEQSKEKMLPMMSKSIPAIKQTKRCLETANDQA